MTAVHEYCNEMPPERSDDYFCELDKAVSVFTKAEANLLSDFKSLTGSHYVAECDKKSGTKGRMYGWM
jgi:hypothetical protein